MYEGLRVRGNLGDSEEAREQEGQKSAPQGKGRAGVLEIERVSFWFTGVKGQRRDRQGTQGLGFGNRASSTELGRQEWGSCRLVILDWYCFVLGVFGVGTVDVA